MEKVIVDGHIVDRDKVNIDMEDRGYQFGDGVYEVIRVYEGRFFTAKEHLERLYRSLEKVKITLEMSLEEMKSNLQQLIEANGLDCGFVYLQITRGAAPRAHIFPGENVKPVLTAYTREMPRPYAAHKEGVKALLADDIRWLRCDIKSLNLLPNLLAKQTAAEKGCYEAILHRGDTVTEGSSSNVFIVKNGEIKTHPATNLILNGITRQVIARICGENDIPFREETFTVDELLNADEVFVASTTSEVMPVIQVDDAVYNGGEPGTLTKRLQKLFVDAIYQ